MNENNKASTGEMAKVAAQKQAAAGKLRQRGRRKEQAEDKLDPQKDKDQIRKSLRAIQTEIRKVKTHDGSIEKRKVQVPDEDAAPVNQHGFKEIWSLIDGMMNRNVTYAYQNSNDEKHSGVSSEKALILKIMEKYDELGIESVDDCELIDAVVGANIKATLTKARGGRGMENDETIRDVRRVETDDTSNQQTNKGPFSGLFGG